MPPDALRAPLRHSCHKRYPGMQGSPLSPERWVSTRMMMSASPFDARRAVSLLTKLPPQFQSRILAPRWPPRRQARAEGEEAGAASPAAMAGGCSPPAVPAVAGCSWLLLTAAAGGDSALGGLTP